MLHIIAKTKPVLFSLLFISASAMAAATTGSVITQKECSFSVEGLADPTAGQLLKVTTQDKKELAAKITAVSKQTTTAEFINPKECPNVVGASVQSEKAKPAVAKPSKFGVSASLGTHSYDTELTYGASNSFTFAGFNTGLMGEYYANRMQTISLGLNWYTGSASIVAANTGSEINLTQSGLYLRMQAGVHFDMIYNVRLLLTPFLDYGLTGSYKIEDNTGSSTYKFKSSLRYGGSIGADYLLMPKLRVGANANLTKGSFQLGEDYTRATNKTANILGMGAAVDVAWSI